MEETKRWMPNLDKNYFIPSLTGELLHVELHWQGDPSDYRYYNRGLVCKTQKEAVKKAELILKALEVSNERG